MLQIAVGQTFTVSTAFGNGADIELTENGGPDGAAVAGGNGTKVNMNARWNGNNMPPDANPDRNEWAVMRFDLSEHADKSMLANVTLNFFMHRENTNNNRALQFYALTPGTTGEDWDETTTTYETMPGFTFDANSITNILDVGGAIVDLGTFTTAGVEVEGSLATIAPRLADADVLTSLVRVMGTSDLLTVMVTTAVSTNGQWRALTKEASGSEMSVISGDVGNFAPFLQFATIDVSDLPGDYNENDVVDAADYVFWRHNFGSLTSLPNDDTPGVDTDDYDRWRANFGRMASGSGGSTDAAPAPEPAALVLAIVAVCCLQLFRRRKA